MIIPEDVLQKQICSQCHKYLSIGPIKVYPNREVRCGRCSTDDDGGVQSPIYQTVVKDMMFPCVNRYDGCNTTLPISKMTYHERDCFGGIYDCFVCSGFRGIAYDLNLHCQKYHQRETLQNSEFLIDFSSYQNEIFFHSKGIQLFFIHCNYDTDLGKLTLHVIFIGKCYKGIMSHSLRLCSIEKELMHTTKPSLCSIMESTLGTRTVVNTANLKFPRKLAVCQFFIHEEPELNCIENIPIIDSSFETCILKCSFKNIAECNFEEAVFFPAVYYFKEMKWRVCIKRKLSLTDYKRKFGVFLQWENSHGNTIETCKVSATFSLILGDQKKLSKSFIKREYKTVRQTHGLMMADWNYVTDPEQGFVNDNCIDIEVKMRIYAEAKKEVICNDCNNKCVYCTGEAVSYQATPFRFEI